MALGPLQRWSMVAQGQRPRRWIIGTLELLLPTGTGHGGSSRGGKNEEELTRVRFRPSPELVWRQGCGATAVELRLGMVTTQAR
jgi:hypothetical protein